MNCSLCLGKKPLSEFNSAMATMPWAAVCGPCKAAAETGPRRLVRLPNLRNFPASARRGEGRGQCSAPAVLELRRPRLPGEGLPLLSQMREAVGREASRGRESPTALPKVQGQVIAGRSAGKNGQVLRFR